MAWEKYREHAAATAYRRPDTDGPFYMRAHTPNTPAEWARQMRGTHPAHGVQITEPTEGNPMQSAPFVMFAAFDARGQYRHGAHGVITMSHPYAVTTYCEGDLCTEFYATTEDRDRALFLLERAA